MNIKERRRKTIPVNLEYNFTNLKQWDEFIIKSVKITGKQEFLLT